MSKLDFNRPDIRNIITQKPHQPVCCGPVAGLSLGKSAQEQHQVLDKIGDVNLLELKTFADFCLKFTPWEVQALWKGDPCGWRESLLPRQRSWATCAQV